ncbi:MAG: Fic family protein [Patescibacteria group bacterium]|nr:Fic family protein [Patescibacteria group bacterium]
MFTPKYIITEQLLANIKRISILIGELNNRRFPKVILLEMEKTAREVSTYASTSIEGNPLPLTEVKKVLKSKPLNARDSEREVLNYNQALTDLEAQLKSKSFKLTISVILTIHKQVVTGLLPKFETGKFRQKPVVINNPRSGKVVYLPPDIEAVAKLMDDLVTYVNDFQSAVDSLILAGIFHKQMVIIHPFMDGNGRTTRLITKALLAKMGLNTFNLFSFENYYNKNVTKYFEVVGEFGDYNELVANIDFTPWLEYFSGGIIDELLRVKKLLPKSGNSPETKLESYHISILTFIRENGFIRDRDYTKLTSRAKATRALDFQKLLNLGMITRKGKGRSTYYQLKEN